MTETGIGPPQYRWVCSTCRQKGLAVSRYGSAEHAGLEHTKEFQHTTHIIDHYNRMVVGSTRRPGDPPRL